MFKLWYGPNDPKLLIHKMNQWLVKYSGTPIPSNDEFYGTLDEIYNELLSMSINYNKLDHDSDLLKTFKTLNKILQLLKKNNNMDPVNNLNIFTRFIQLSRISAQFKSIIISGLQMDPIKCSIYFRDLFQKFDIHNKMEEYACDVYKSKIEIFKSNFNEKIVHTINENFTLFLLDFVKLLSQLNDEVPLNNNIELLLEVADDKILLNNFHSHSFLLTSTTKICLMKKITKFCIKNNSILNNCGFMISKHKDFKLEACIISYFIFQRICKHLELQKMHQSSKILSMFTIDDISLINNSSLNLEFEKLYEESVKHITFKKCENIKVVPIHKISKYLQTLKILLSSLSSQFQNCPYAVVLLSILSELVMETDIDKDTTMCLIDLITGYLDFCKLPSNFLAISYAFNIYQKIKIDPDLELLSKNLCRLLINKMILPKADDEMHNKTLLQKPKLNQYLKDDLERVLNIQDCWIDKSIIGSYFLIGLESTYIMEDETLNNLLWTLNENVLLSTQYATTNPLLIFPYSVSLHFSIKMKNEDCLFNNLSILDNYLNIAYEIENETNLQPLMEFEKDYSTITDSQCFEQEYFLKTILLHYECISQCLPNDFLIKYWEFMFNPQKKLNGHSKKILILCSPDNLIKIIDILKTKTIELFETSKDIQFDYYLIIRQLWSDLLTMEFINKKKKIRKELVNHFCFILNRTFIFNSKKIKSVKGLILLIQLICSLLKLSWINKTMLMNCSFRIMNFFENICDEVEILIEAAELLIVLYKCPNNSIKPLLGLYVNTFSNFLNQCWSVAIDETSPLFNYHLTKLYVPFHKLELCSSLFKQNKKDFEVICQYFIADLIKILATRKHPKEVFMRFLYKILFNLMDICSPEEMRQLMLNIQGPSLLYLKHVYKEYQSHIKFTGRL